MLKLEINGNRIKAKFAYEPPIDIQMKLAGIPGGNESRDRRTWSWPVNMTVCEKARAEFGNDIEIGPNLLAWANEYRRREDVVRSAQNAKEGDDRDALSMLPSVARYARPLFDLVSGRWYQVEGAHALASAERMILADQPGLGKTYQSLAGTLEHFYSRGNYSPLILVLAPSTVVTTAWEPSILTQVPGCFVYTMDGSRPQRQGMLEAVMEEYDADDDPGPRFVLGNPEMARITVWWKCTKALSGRGKTAIRCGREWASKKEEKQSTDSHGNKLWVDRYSIRWYKNEDGAFVRVGETDPPEEYEQDFLVQPVKELAMCTNEDHIKHHRLQEAASYETMLEHDWDAVILDESQRVLITNSSVKTKMSMQRRGMMRLRAPIMQALSGTPYRGRPQRLWGTLNWLDPQGHPSFRKWVDYHFHVMEYEHHDGIEIGGLNADTEEAFLKSQGAIMLRRTKGEVADQLPPKQYNGWWLDEDNQQPGGHGIWLPMEGHQARSYKSMRDDAVAALDGGTLNALGVLAEMTRLRQFASSDAKLIADGKDGQYVQPVLPSNKLNWCQEFLETLDGKVVIVSQFTGLLDMFEIVLRQQTEMKGAARKDYGKIVKITGAVTGKKRAEAQHAFQHDPDTRIMLLNLQAGGVGIDLDRQCDDMIFLDEPYIPDDAEQAEDRIHRVSRMDHTCTYHYLRSLGTIEETIARTTGGRDVIQKRLLDGARGVEFARTLVSAR